MEGLLSTGAEGYQGEEGGGRSPVVAKQGPHRCSAAQVGKGDGLEVRFCWWDRVLPLELTHDLLCPCVDVCDEVDGKGADPRPTQLLPVVVERVGQVARPDGTQGVAAAEIGGGSCRVSLAGV